MRFETVRERLRYLPAEFPEPPEALIPVHAETGEARQRVSPDGLRVRHAAVLVLLFPDETGEACVVLTERVDRGGHHSGEVSFPGGSTEPDDASMAETALREAREEVGLDPDVDPIQVVAELPSFWIPVSGFRVTPIIAVAERRPALDASPDEVVQILEAPLSAFLPGAPIETVERKIRGWPLRYGAYPVGGLLVWGATARVLGQIGAVLASSWEEPEQREVT